MNSSGSSIILIDIGEPPAREGTKFYSPVEKKIEKTLHEIAQRMDCNIVRNIILKKSYLRQDLIERGVLWHQIDFAFVKDKIWTAIEIDGKNYHIDDMDDLKDDHLFNEGWNVIRIKASMINKHMSSVVNIIEEFLASGKQGKYISIPERETNGFDDEDREWLREEKEFEAWLIEGPARTRKISKMEEIF